MKCIYCGGDTKKTGKNNNKQRYKCDNGCRTFNEDTLKRLKGREEKYNKIKKMYLEEKLSTTEIGKRLGVSSTIPQRILKSMGLTRSISEAKKGKKMGSKLPTTKIVDMYLNGKSSITIAKELGCSKSSVLKILRDNGVERDNTYEYPNLHTDEVKQLYENGDSMVTVSNKLNMSYSVVNRILHKLNIVRTEDKYGIGMDYEIYLETLSKIYKYKSDVYKITNKQPINKLPNYDKRGLAGIVGSYHLDHKYSVMEGYRNGIDPKIIGHITNLEFIPWFENISKKDKCSITIEVLNELYNKDTNNG